jgi:acetyltransferase-like isoleucine patch superfamily enzyme
MKRWPRVDIKIGERAEIDEDVILGYPSGRLQKGGALVLGARARIRSGSVIYQAVTIGHDFETGHHVVVREENRIGDSVSIWTNTVIDYGCRIGNRVKIHSNVYVAQYTVIEDDVFIAPGVIFANDKYPVSDRLEGPRVKKGARVGVNATILPGIVIGQEALVGAGSVVTKDVPDRAVVVGNPARVIGTVDEIDTKKEGLLKKVLKRS